VPGAPLTAALKLKTTVTLQHYIYNTITALHYNTTTLTSVQIGMISQFALLREPFSAYIARVRSLPGVYAHVSDQRVVNRELTLTDLTAVNVIKM